MTVVWAVARQTFAQCLRTKIGGLFIVLLAVAMLVSPMLAGDRNVPLADRIRAFLSYGMGMVTFLMIVVTVFLGARVVAGDVTEKHVFLLAVKPLARWQYILGRWLGITMLDAVLLALAGAGVYAIAQHMRAQDAINADDRRAIETEVFTSRRRIGPDMQAARDSIEQNVAVKIRQLKEQGAYEPAMDKFRPEAGGNAAKAADMLADEYRKQLWEHFESVAPGMSLRWNFNGIAIARDSLGGRGIVRQRDPDQGLIEIEAPRELLGLLLYGRPVQVAGIDGRVVHLGPNTFAAKLMQTETTRVRLAGLGRQSPVDIVLDPVIQLTYKASALKPTNGAPLYSLWFVQTPPPEDRSKPHADDFMDFIPRTDAPGLPATMTVSSRAVDRSGRTQVTFVNSVRPDGFATSVSIPASDISILYRVGTFEANFLRGLAMILVQLMFIAAMAIFAGSFLSFPVACLLVFVLLPFGLAGDYLADAAGSMGVDLGATLCRYVVTALRWLVPNFDSLSPSEALVGGLAIPWDLPGLAPVAYAMAGILAVLGGACLIWRSRELARVQV